MQEQNLFLQTNIDSRWRAFVNYEFVNTLIEPERMDNLFNFGFSSTGARVRLTAGLPKAYNIMQRPRARNSRSIGTPSLLTDPAL